ncbi:ATP-binding cassette domain-containing protein [Embleya sp. NPDC001921]
MTFRADDDDSLIERLDLTLRRDVRVGRSSGGEKRRLDPAVAVYGRPALLFLDEPTAGLDPQSRDLLWDLVREPLDDGATVVPTTHYLEEAGALAERIAIMREGRLAVEGALADLIAPYPARITLDPGHHSRRGVRSPKYAEGSTFVDRASGPV